jgi:ammonia channel protein AmtB
MQNVVDTTITIALYFVVGFAFAGNSGNGFIGTQVRCFSLLIVHTRKESRASLAIACM